MVKKNDEICIVEFFITLSSFLCTVLPTAVATTINIAIDLPYEGIPEQFGRLVSFYSKIISFHKIDIKIMIII